MAQAATKDFDPTTDSWAPGEPVPKGMPAADGGAPSGGAAPDKVTSGLADIKRREMGATQPAFNDLSSKIDEGMAKVEVAQKNAGVEPGLPKPWNAAEESAKHQTDPIEAFGSLGSAFGILASAFTHQPFDTALNASAAAITAIKNGDAKEYDRAYKAWQDNTKLALDRHKIQHDQYEDAVSLLKTNIAAGQAKMQVLAAKFGDEKTLFLLDNGMDKEVLELQAGRQKLAMQLQENYPKMVMANAQMSRLFALGYDTKDPQSEKSQKALVQFQNEQAELKHKERAFGGTGILTPGRQQAAAIQTRMAELTEQAKAEGKTLSQDDAYAQATREIKRETAVPTGNRIDELKGKINQVHLAKTTIGHIEEMLKKHNAIVGLGGKVTRPAEVLGNIFGSDETDRKQTQRWISELQEIAPRILLDSKGRPLSSEAGRVENIIAGLQFGDTVANTSRAYYEFKKVLDQIEQGLGERIGGESAKPASPVKPDGDWWKSAPKVH